ncbi:3-oxoacyl-[acyl-carrier-protein] reductase [Prosthecobacter algae]|uniref:3-oxoacyl-[acyl-carrier-protein] reductase n=1 Tax=Prosthecobacter algae TaxID=1144682 RepID=A0ABP9PB01_9BACT
MQSLISTLENATVIVTGGSRGYGAGIAEAFVKAGARVWITGRDAERLQTTAHKIGAIPFSADVADGQAWDRLIEEVLNNSGRLDVLVNNAGEGVKVCQTSEQTDEAIVRSLASNLTGAMLGCRRAAAIMQSQRSGLIVNIGSACSTHAWPGWSIYSAAKAGLLMFTRCLLTELRPHGVRVTSVMPSWGQTEFTEAANLPPRDPAILTQCISPADLGQLIVQTACLPPHLIAEEIKLWPMVQPMTQL